MKVIFTKLAKRKFRFLREIGWSFKPDDIKKVLEEPTKVGLGYSGTKTALISIDANHNLLVVYSEEDDIIKIVTFYPVKKGRYES